jgi:F0F1-type ATP synthase assembly protein I
MKKLILVLQGVCIVISLINLIFAVVNNNISAICGWGSACLGWAVVFINNY